MWTLSQIMWNCMIWEDLNLLEGITEFPKHNEEWSNCQLFTPWKQELPTFGWQVTSRINYWSCILHSLPAGHCTVIVAQGYEKWVSSARPASYLVSLSDMIKNLASSTETFAQRKERSTCYTNVEIWHWHKSSWCPSSVQSVLIALLLFSAWSHSQHIH